ncbi:MAG: GNAT family N-acetyltransferase, partial [Eubacteriales bacterium]
MTFDNIFSAALKQSAIDLNCLPEDLVSSENRVVISKANPMARKYLTLPFACNLVSYGGNIVASVSPQFHSAASAYISRF